MKNNILIIHYLFKIVDRNELLCKSIPQRQMVCQVEQHPVKQEEGDACLSFIAKIYEGWWTQESQQGSVINGRLCK